MCVEPRPVASSELGSLQGCLMEGDPEQRLRERCVRRKSLILSVVLQGLVCAAIVLIPLFGKPARIALANVVPLPPYYAHAEQHSTERHTTQIPRQQHTVCRFCAPTSIPLTIVTHTEPIDDDPQPPGFLDAMPGQSSPSQIPIVDTRAHPVAPVTAVETPKKIHVTHLDPAMLKVRIEPIYPTLMRQIGRAGQVQLHAIIGTDGTIQSLQIVSGDPGFYQSALAAVQQWRYKPTVLNGNPVEVDTFITVIYNIGR
jgi:periplasmic protein TonB